MLLIKHLFRNIDDINEDILLNEKVIKLYNERGELYSHHKVEKYKVVKGDFKGDEYYLFRLKDGKSVMNYNSDDYCELSAHLDISFDYPIFMTYGVGGYKDLKPVPVCPDYRLKQKNRDFKF